MENKPIGSKNWNESILKENCLKGMGDESRQNVIRERYQLEFGHTTCVLVLGARQCEPIGRGDKRKLLTKQQNLV